MCERMEREGILNSDSFQCGKTKVRMFFSEFIYLIDPNMFSIYTYYFLEFIA